jgi:hypothetical protein
MYMRHRLFRGTLVTWDALCREAEDFATQLGPGNVVSISHSCDGAEGVIIVWYWSGSPEEE